MADKIEKSGVDCEMTQRGDCTNGHTSESDKHILSSSPSTNTNTDYSASEKQGESKLSKTLKDLDINQTKLEDIGIKDENVDVKKGKEYKCAMLLESVSF